MAGWDDYRYNYMQQQRSEYESPMRPQTFPDEYQLYAQEYPHYQFSNSFPTERGDFEFRSPRTVPIESPDDDTNVRKYFGISVGLVSLITENLLSHPFLVLRRQCQVHHSSHRYHLIPVTLVPVIVHLHQSQGLTSLWKGIGSVLMVRGLSLAVEDLVSKITPWPKEIDSNCTMKTIGQHLLLKCVSLAIVMPFYSASLVETVQSGIASEKPGLFDVFKEGACRLLAWGVPQKGRMLPVWALVVPTVGYGLCKYIISTVVNGISMRYFESRYRRIQQRQGAIPKDTTPQVVLEDFKLNSTLLSIFVSDIILYPFETIIHRLHLQGTRTIIDNLDTGYSVVAILTNYEGAKDCYTSSITSEGVSGLYKGFGALLLQFAAHFAVIRLTKWILTEATIFLGFNSPVQQKPSNTSGISSAQSSARLLDPQTYLIN